jgi:hypothetical protein
MKGIMDHRIAREEHIDLPDEFIRTVLQFPKVGIHAQRNAAYSAQLTEDDRRATRMAEIEELLGQYQSQRDQLNVAIFTLEGEYELLRPSTAPHR